MKRHLIVSVIIPIKNSFVTLKRCLESLQTQSYNGPLEIIVVENGSNDVNWHEGMPEFKLLQFSWSSRSRARNVGASMAKGDLLIFLDADVVPSATWLEKLVFELSNNCDLFLTSIIPWSHQKNLTQQIRFRRAATRTKGTFISILRDREDRLVVNSSAFGIRREIFEQINGFDELLIRHEDLDFTRRVLQQAVRIKAISKPWCLVFFESGFWSYVHREFEQGYHIVRYHQKWSQGTLKAFKGGLLYFILNLRSLCRVERVTLIGASEVLLTNIYLLGSYCGFFVSIIKPYPTRHTELAVRAQIIKEVEFSVPIHS